MGMHNSILFYVLVGTGNEEGRIVTPEVERLELEERGGHNGKWSLLYYIG